MADMDKFLTWLASEHDQIIGCERKAIEALNRGDTDGYKKFMEEKAEMLANIANTAKSHTADLPSDMAKEIMGVLQNFANSAATGIKLHSIFYMSALLYRDDHKPGEPDNLEVYIRSLRENFSGDANG